MRSIGWSETALTQFDDAIDWLAERNESAAANLAGRIRDTLMRLADRPTGRPGQRDGTFEKRVQGTSYLVVYVLTGGPTGTLRVVRLFHTSQDWVNWTPEPGDL